MARKLNEFDFNERIIYPWNFWLNGEIWELTDSDIGDTPLVNFRTTLYANARSRGLKMRSTLDPVNGTLTFQAYDG